MKKLSLLSFPLLAFLFQSCSGGAGSPGQTDTVFTTTCYIAIDGRDTARMTLKTFDKGVKGNLLIKYHQKDKNEGDFKGYFKGDTLLVDYGFRVGKQKIWYKNPLAFLKQADSLLMGIGEMQNRWGRTYFVRGKQINFKQGRFIFLRSDCQ